jgi:uncharacterized protein YbbK (DUF523 family)
MVEPEYLPKVAFSACLLGQNVRYNGGHCNFALFDRLNNYVERISFCPEVGIGLGTPGCGLERVKIYSEKKHPQKNSAGLFSMIFTTLYPHIPAIEEGRLFEPFNIVSGVMAKV